MHVTALDSDNEDLYLVCLEEWSSGMAAAKQIKKKWFDDMKKKGPRATSGSPIVGSSEV
ncbi:hypothetical protein ACFL27_06320 [candidate division CSSED10-310 bacterium]|uniref:Uncharacterized protein n=1 Tax=candidate division CSSED10-310 bacterium TaxID=2855610 RepID=A0ABV6YUC8_UNCC1